MSYYTLTECIYEFGPLNVINCFAFEELNRKFMSFIHGKDLIGEEFIKIFNTAQCLSKVESNKIFNSQIHTFLEQNPCFLTSNRKRLHINNNRYKILSSKVLHNDPNHIKIINEHLNQNLAELCVFNKILYNGILYTHFENKTKHNDSCFVTKSDIKYGLIVYMTELNNKVYIIAQKIVNAYNPFYCEKYPDYKSKTFICHITDEYFVVDIEDIEKDVLLKVNEIECFLSTFKTSHLFT